MNNLIKRRILRTFAKNPLALISLVYLLLIAVLAIFGERIAPYQPDRQDLYQVLQKPSAQHLAGTDHLGRDVLSRTIVGSRYSLLSSFGVVLIATTLGCLVGALTGMASGWAQYFGLRIVDAWLSFPTLLIALVIVAILGRGFLSVIFAVALVSSAPFARILSTSIKKLINEPYVEISFVLGGSRLQAFFWHVFPNSITPILMQASVLTGQALLITASLSFLGLGARPPTPEWGLMVSETQTYLRSAPFTVIAPGLAIMLTVITSNILGDTIRDILDVRTTTFGK